MAQKGPYPDSSQGADSIADDIANFLAFLFFVRKNKMSTIAGKRVAVQYFHRRAGIQLPLRHSYLQRVKAGLAGESGIHD